MLGEKLKALRKERNLKQDDIGELFGITKASVSNWENGRRSPNIQQLQRLANFYHVPLDYFQEKQSFRIDMGVDELLQKTKSLLISEQVSIEDKERIFNEVMRLYLEQKNK